MICAEWQGTYYCNYTPNSLKRAKKQLKGRAKTGSPFILPFFGPWRRFSLRTSRHPTPFLKSAQAGGCRAVFRRASFLPDALLDEKTHTKIKSAQGVGLHCPHPVKKYALYTLTNAHFQEHNGGGKFNIGGGIQLTESEKMLLEEIRQLRAQLAEKEKRPRVEAKGQATRALSEQEYEEFIETMRAGFAGAQPNPRVAKALTVQAATGLRISDVLQLTPGSIVHYDRAWHFDIIEQKTGKPRKFLVQDYVATDLRLYCAEQGIKGAELIFPFKVRNVQQRVKNVADYLDLKNISTHSFRKFFATKIYNENGYNISLLQKIMQHASPQTTQRYIGVDQKEIDAALSSHIVKL